MRFFLILLLIFTTQAYAFETEECKPLTEKACIDYAEKIIDGFLVARCWKYEQKHKCLGKEENHCSPFEDNRGCNEVAGECRENTEFGICKHFEKKFVCGSKLEEKQETRLVDTQYNIIKDEQDLAHCFEEEVNKYCEVIEETCVEGRETRNIGGQDVTKDCWKWDRKYICKTDTYIDECKELKEKCREISRQCLHRDAGKCEHWEVKYNCSEEVITTSPCIAKKFCIGDKCQTKKRKSHNDFAASITHLNILASMKSNEFEGCKCPKNSPNCSPTEIDASNCKFFKGDNGKCLRHTGSHNCCSDKGALRQMFGCNSEAKALAEKRKAKLCHHVHTWKGKGPERFKKWQSHCCFKSKLARIIQVEGRKQLGIGWGDLESPDCGGLTLDEIRKIDFSKIKFDELFEEVKAKAQATLDTKKSEMQSKIGNLKNNPTRMSELISKKINKFYKDARD